MANCHLMTDYPPRSLKLTSRGNLYVFWNFNCCPRFSVIQQHNINLTFMFDVVWFLCVWLKAECISTIHVGEIINSMEKATLIPGGSEAIVYTTLSGTVGMLAPFSSREVRGLWSRDCQSHPFSTCPAGYRLLATPSDAHESGNAGPVRSWSLGVQVILLSH